MKTGWRLAAGIVVVGLLFPVVASADYKESFKAGMEAVDRKNWEAVVRHMQAAIDDNPKSGGDVRMAGTRMEDYLPYYYLGMALNELGRYVEAKAALDEMGDQGALASAPRRITRNAFRLISEVGAKVDAMPSTTRDASQNPRTQGSRSSPPRQAVPTGPTPAQQLATARTGAEAELATASDARARLTSLVQRADQLGVFATAAGLRARWDQANEQLGAARRQLETATSAATADSVKSTAIRLAGEFIQIETELQRQIQSAERTSAEAEERALQTQDRVANLLRSIQNDLPEAQRLLARATELSHPSTRAASQRLARSITEARAASTDSSADALQSLQQTLRSSAADMRSALASIPGPEADPADSSTPGGEAASSATPPPTLRRAAAAFFGGDDDSTLSVLADAQFDDPRASFQAGLLKAAALYRKFLAGQRSDSGLLEAARAEAARCRSLDRSFEPDPRYFSPDFVSLYRDATGP